MNIRDLGYVVAVADHGHFGRAAQACFVSQPTLSGQIRSLEEDLGVTLFERGNKVVRTTAAGARIVELARTLLEQSAAIRDAARELRDPMSGVLRLGVIPTVAPYLLPRLLGPLRRAHPALGLVLAEAVTGVLLERLADHQLDAVILATDETGPELSELPLYREPFQVAIPRGHPLCESERVPLLALKSLDVLLLADGHCLTDQVRDLCQWGSGDERTRRAADSATSGDDLRATSLETLLQLVAVGFGLTLVPELALHGSRLQSAAVTMRPLDSRSAGRTVRLVYRSGFPLMAMLLAFAQVLRANLPDCVQVLVSEADKKPGRGAGKAKVVSA